MIISHKHRIIFLKSQKCAGTSVELALSQCCGPDDVITTVGPIDERLRCGPGPQNVSVPAAYRPVSWQLREQLGLRVSRLGSVYYSHMPALKIRRSMDPTLFDAYRKVTVVRNPWDRVVSLYFWHYRKHEQRPGFDWFVRMPRFRASRKTFDLYAINGQIVATDILRYERLGDDFDAFMATLGVDEPPSLPRAKGAHRPKDTRSYREFYNAGTREIVARRYKREIEAFGYEF
jgi:Sulfotransferase family